MKKILTVFLLSAVLGSLALAHSPSEVTASFDSETSLLKVSFSHPVKETDKHYIVEVKIFMNGKQIIEQKLLSQENTEGGELVFKITDAKPGDKLRINARCNKIGAKTTDLTIE